MDNTKNRLTGFFENPFWVGVFEKYKNGILDFSVNDDIKIGFFLVTDYSTSKILRIS